MKRPTVKQVCDAIRIHRHYAEILCEVMGNTSEHGKLTSNVELRKRGEDSIYVIRDVLGDAFRDNRREPHTRAFVKNLLGEGVRNGAYWGETVAVYVERDYDSLPTIIFEVSTTRFIIDTIENFKLSHPEIEFK